MPAENVEKIIVSLCFSLCKDDFVYDLINFCQDNWMSTAVMYLCLNFTPQVDSCILSLRKLRHIYLRARNEGDVITMQKLVSLPANSTDKIPIERTKVYIGYKLLWAIRMILDGKSFPSGNLRDDVWRQYVHDVADLMTEQEFMLTLMQIDSAAYF